MHQQNMIGNLKVLNSKETKHIIEVLLEQYGYVFDKHSNEYVFLMNKDNRIYLVSRTIDAIPYDTFRMDSTGMYFGELYKESVRLSIEGSQLIGPKATKNIIELTKDEMLEWIKGKDIEFIDEDNEFNRGFIIIRYTDSDKNYTDYLGAGKYKEGKILNYVSKSRRLVVVNN